LSKTVCYLLPNFQRRFENSSHVGNATKLGSRRQEVPSRGEELAERRGLHQSIRHLVVVVEVISVRLASSTCFQGFRWVVGTRLLRKWITFVHRLR
jgi:hypothetical protein